MRRKQIGLVAAVILIVAMLSGCFAYPDTSGHNSISAGSDEHKTTPEEAISKYYDEKEINPQIPYSYLLIDKYIFLLYGDEVTGGYKNEEDGYRMSLPLGFKLQSYIPNVPKNLLYYVGIVKNGTDYQIELHGYKVVDGDSVIENNDVVKISDSNGNKLEKLYVDSDESEVCVWVTVLHELPDDYKITLEYHDDIYTVIDAQTIKEMIG